MKNIDEQIDKLRPFTEREKEIFKLGADFGMEELAKKMKKKAIKSTWFEIEISD